MEEITKARRKAIAESIRTISVEELKALGEQLFPLVGDPWRENFFAFLAREPRRHVSSRDGARRRSNHLLSREGQGHVVHAGNRHGPDAAKGAGDFEADCRRALARTLHHAIRLTARSSAGKHRCRRCAFQNQVRIRLKAGLGDKVLPLHRQIRSESETLSHHKPVNLTTVPTPQSCSEPPTRGLANANDYQRLSRRANSGSWIWL